MKKIIILAVIVIIAYFFFFFGGGSNTHDTLDKQVDSDVILDGDLSLMNQEIPEIGSFAKIDDDLSNGEITLGQMYVYKIVAMYGAHLLPEKYSSLNVDPLRGDRIFMMIQEDFDKLEPETQILLKPFALPFSDEESFFYGNDYEKREEIISNLAQF